MYPDGESNPGLTNCFSAQKPKIWKFPRELTEFIIIDGHDFGGIENVEFLGTESFCIFDENDNWRCIKNFIVFPFVKQQQRKKWPDLYSFNVFCFGAWHNDTWHLIVNNAVGEETFNYLSHIVFLEWVRMSEHQWLFWAGWEWRSGIWWRVGGFRTK